MWMYGNIAERNAVLLVMSPFNVPIACAQVNIDKSRLSTDYTVRVRKHGLQTGPQEYSRVTQGFNGEPSIRTGQWMSSYNDG